MTQLRVAMPGIIQSFNSTEQTVTVQPAIKENIIKADQTRETVNLPLLLDVPIVLPRAGNFVLTIPPKQGDECLIVFSDRCIDAWWSNGGVQPQLEKRYHDLSDAFCILGIYSQPNRVSNYSLDASEWRTLDGNTKISLKKDEINIISKSIKMNGVDVTPK